MIDDLVSEVFGPDAAVTSRVRLPGGASRETWALGVTTPYVTTSNTSSPYTTASDTISHDAVSSGGATPAGAGPGGEPPSDTGSGGVGSGRPVSSGAGSGGVTHELILRLDSPGAAPDPGAGTTGIGLAGEARLMWAAETAGVPVPRVLAAGGSYILMSRVDGETIPRRILRDDAFAGARPLLAAQCGEILAAIHRMPLASLGPATPAGPGPEPRGAAEPGRTGETRDLGGAAGPGRASGPEDRRTVPGAVPDDPLRAWRDVLDLTGRPHPVFELAFRRLAASRPTSERVTVVHGDFRNGNLVVGPSGVRSVLDWELAHAGDPMEDLGWLCAKSWRFGSPLPVGGFGEYEWLVGSYERASGHRVDRDALRWWETFGMLKWGIICVMQTLRHLEGGARSVELAAIGRRVCETEWDLLEALT